jgi:hypothetical protein
VKKLVSICCIAMVAWMAMPQAASAGSCWECVQGSPLIGLTRVANGKTESVPVPWQVEDAIRVQIEATFWSLVKATLETETFGMSSVESSLAQAAAAYLEEE